MVAYRSPASEVSTPGAPLPSIAEVARARAMTLSAPTATLRQFFEEISAAHMAELMRGSSIWKDLLFNAAVLCSIAAVAGAARFILDPGVPLLVVSFAAGTAYGVGRVVTWQIRFVGKRTGQDMTVVVPLIIGFGLGLFGFGVEALLSLLPVPSVASAALLAGALFAVWFKRYGEPALSFDHVPQPNVTRSLLALADLNTISHVTWHDPAALPSDGLTYQASVTRSDAVRVTCAMYTYPAGSTLQVLAEFPPSYRWRHAGPVVLDGITLEASTTASGVVVGPRIPTPRRHPSSSFTRSRWQHTPAPATRRLSRRADGESRSARAGSSRFLQRGREVVEEPANDRRDPPHEEVRARVDHARPLAHDGRPHHACETCGRACRLHAKREVRAVRVERALGHVGLSADCDHEHRRGMRCAGTVKERRQCRQRGSGLEPWHRLRLEVTALVKYGYDAADKLEFVEHFVGESRQVIVASCRHRRPPGKHRFSSVVGQASWLASVGKPPSSVGAPLLTHPLI